ncbi:MAG: biotin--[acetyl-CoA-carboxylase] ligase, partial [Flavobacteriales bacterium]
MKGVFRKNIVHFKEVESTNLLALSMIKENTTPLPFVITTDFQTLGKGQLSNKWESENGKNLLMSIAINTNIKTENQFILNVIVSLSVLDLLENLNLENLSVKWPNDILIGNRKISGILIQNKLLSDTIKSTVIGIGLNINQIKFTNFKREATSVKNENITNLSILEVIDRLLEFLEFRFAKSDNKNWKDY